MKSIRVPIHFRLGLVSLVVFTRLADKISLLMLFPILTTTSCFLIVHLYRSSVTNIKHPWHNHTEVTTTFWKWIIALMLRAQTCNKVWKGNSSQRYLSNLGCEPVTLTIVPWIVRTCEQGVFFFCNFRSSLSQMFLKLDVLKNFPIFTKKLLFWSLFLIKLQAWRPVVAASVIWSLLFKNSPNPDATQT